MFKPRAARAAALGLLLAATTTLGGTVGCDSPTEPLVAEPTVDDGPDPWTIPLTCLSEGEVCRIGESGGVIPGCCSGLVCGELNTCEPG
jgi:hypothetical protein